MTLVSIFAMFVVKDRSGKEAGILKMSLELEYASQVSEAHTKKYAQYFTPYRIADFMCSWVCRDAASVLDPALGNSVFLTHAKKVNPFAALTGYEIDPRILSFFGNPSDARIHQQDYILSDWEARYDAILCNPPYHRFQDISNRRELIDAIRIHTGITYSSYTNLYLLFLIKSLSQLSENGRLGYLIPSEFLNSRYGTAVKEKLLRERLLKAVINFEKDEDLFPNATTTCCILLIDHTEKESILFYNLSSLEELDNITVTSKDTRASLCPYQAISAGDKWRSFLKQESKSSVSLRNLKRIDSFCKISRGIATGDNDFFCLSRKKAAQYHISPEYLSRCVSRSADIKTLFFTDESFAALEQADRKVLLLDIKMDQKLDDHLCSYLAYGKAQGVDQKNLPSHRIQWYYMEQRAIAPIWVTTACREGIKFVRNLAGISSLTTFHSIYLKPEYESYTDILFCYFLTRSAQDLILQNRKELGNGLAKFQPSDLKEALMLDLTLVTEKDLLRITAIYEEMKKNVLSSHLTELEQIFCSYLY